MVCCFCFPVSPITNIKMEDPEMENASIRPKIATLVFMDLESTGLPSDVGRRNVHITEMSLIAVDRNSFEEDKNLRVLNKINLCIRPRSVVSPFAMNITGLYNDILENQEEFDDSIPKLLEYFFRRLQKPICLLAHNGNRFDFPVLQAELNRLNYTLGSYILCADTLIAFRSICNLRKEAVALETERKAREENISKQTKSCSAVPITDEDIDNLLSEDLESFTCIDNVLPITESKILEPEVIENLPSENESKAEETAVNLVQINECLSSISDEQTPQKHKISSEISENIKIRRKRKILDPTYTPQSEYKRRIILPSKRNIFAKRTLFPEYGPTSFEIHKITKFSLQNLYNHFFDENPPNSHYAEVDTISLGKVCQKINQDFLQWIDENCVLFSTINPLW